MKKTVCLWALLILAPCLAQANINMLTDKVERMERDLILLQQKVYRGGTVSLSENGEGTPLNADSGEDLLAKISAQEIALADLTQRIEQLSYDVMSINDKLGKMNADIEVRFNMLEQTPVGSVKEETPKTTDAKQTENKTTSLNIQNEQPKQTPKEQYETAYALLRKGDHVGAEKAFLAFIEAHPKHDLAGNANYWLGETYYARGQFEQAAPIFAEGLTTYKNNIKGPDNLLKLGLTMDKLGKKEQACTAFAAISEEFPKAEQSIKDRAKEEAQKLSCP